jgi:small subunit ribosomal protein S21
LRSRPAERSALTQSFHGPFRPRTEAPHVRVQATYLRLDPRSDIGTPIRIEHRQGEALYRSTCHLDRHSRRRAIQTARARSQPHKESILQVFVRDNNVDQALRILKKKMQREGVFREMKQRRFYEKPSARTTREKGEAVRRARKAARKQAIREGLIAPPKKKIQPGRGRPGAPAGRGSGGVQGPTRA